jgi:hypothetical protein
LITNIHKVPKKQWRKWDIIGRSVFNKTYDLMKENPHLFRHPKDPSISKRWADTTAWNAAWISADHVAEALKEIANS